MKVESLGFYLENLLPGIVILCGILILLSPLPKDTQNLIAQLKESEFLLSALFLTIAYLLGLISAMLSRFIVDNLSELGPRPLFLAQSARHRSYSDLKETLESLANKSLAGQPLMGEEESRRVWRKEVRGAWNSIYRAVLAEVLRSGSERGVAEVQRRREQGRLVRNLFFPLIITSITLPRLIQIGTGRAILLALGMAVISVLLYAYAEYFNFAEASLQLKKKSP